MPDNDDRDLTADEKDALAALSHDVEPPGALEERVVGALRDRGELRSAPAWRRAATVAATLAASLILAFALGYTVGSRGLVATSDAGEPDYALFVFDPPAATPDADTRAAVAAATEWAGELASTGVLVGAEKLRDERRRLEARNGEVVPVAATSFSADSLVLGGLFLIRADSFEEAQRIAAGCPLLRFGSTIEIRAFEDIP